MGNAPIFLRVPHGISVTLVDIWYTGKNATNIEYKGTIQKYGGGKSSDHQ